MSAPADSQRVTKRPPHLPKRQRWLHPLLALAGLSSLPPALPARTLDAAAPIQQLAALRARLLAADAQAASKPVGAASAPADDPVAQWKKWNDWNNWAKWGKE